MQEYERLAEIFELDTIDIDKANRKTLLKYATRTKLQKRREAFYSGCKTGTKSKVSFCKNLERPMWVHNLETLKTKQLRSQLKGFLKELGILKDPSSTNVNKLARDRFWSAVINIKHQDGQEDDDDFDETKRGAGSRSRSRSARRSRSRSRSRAPGVRVADMLGGEDEPPAVQLPPPGAPPAVEHEPPHRHGRDEEEDWGG